MAGLTGGAGARGRMHVNGQRGAGRAAGGIAASRRTFLKGAAAAGVGAAIAALWTPSRVGLARSAAAAPSLGPAGLMGAVQQAANAVSQADDSFWMAHMLRRAGFSATPADVAAFLPLGLNGAVDRLLGYAQTPDPAVDLVNNAGLDLSKVADAQRWW